DIGIILLDQEKDDYKLADILEVKIQENFEWNVNKAYETKEKIPSTVLISNRNNVKGLEFPFVICFTKRIINNPSYRNSIYTMLTRSFIKSFLVTTPKSLTFGMVKGLEQIIRDKKMVIQEPTEKEKEKIRTRFKYNLKKLSHYDLMHEIFNKLKVEKQYHDKLFQLTQQMDMLESGDETLTAFIKDNLKYISK
ncbi:MAG: ATP-binding domain-containing protein, partial [Patescibacteria group bacterium]